MHGKQRLTSIYMYVQSSYYYHSTRTVTECQVFYDLSIDYNYRNLKLESTRLTQNVCTYSNGYGEEKDLAYQVTWK